MRKLNTTLLGGFPLDLNDLQWLSDGLIEAIEQNWRAFGDAYILRGCVVTPVGPTLYNVSAGAVVMDGEVYLFSGATNVTINDLQEAWFVVSAQLDPSGAEVFEDTVTRNAYDLRVAALLVTAIPPATPRCALTAQTLAQRIAEMVGAVTVPWEAVALTNGWALGGLPYMRAEYRREGAKVVRLRGAINGSSSTGVTVGQLPVGFRPPGVMRFPIMSLSSSSVVRIGELDTAGNLKVIIPGTPDVNDVYDLSQVPPFEAL